MGDLGDLRPKRRLHLVVVPVRPLPRSDRGHLLVGEPREPRLVRMIEKGSQFGRILLLARQGSSRESSARLAPSTTLSALRTMESGFRALPRRRFSDSVGKPADR